MLKNCFLSEAILKKGEIERKLKQRGLKLFPVGGRGDTERENMTIQRCIVAKKMNILDLVL